MHQFDSSKSAEINHAMGRKKRTFFNLSTLIICSLENIAGTIIRDSPKRGGQRRKLTFCTDGNAHLIGGYFEPKSGHSKDHLEITLTARHFPWLTAIIYITKRRWDERGLVLALKLIRKLQNLHHTPSKQPHNWQCIIAGYMSQLVNLSALTRFAKMTFILVYYMSQASRDLDGRFTKILALGLNTKKTKKTLWLHDNWASQACWDPTIMMPGSWLTEMVCLSRYHVHRDHPGW